MYASNELFRPIIVLTKGKQTCEAPIQSSHLSQRTYVIACNKLLAEEVSNFKAEYRLPISQL